MKIALITDQHFGVRNDSIQFHEYYRKFYEEFFFPTLREMGIRDIVELGDIFDRRKYVNFDTLSRCRDYFFDPIARDGLSLHCIVGNHDIYFKNTNRVNAPDLLLGEFDLHVYSDPQDVEIGGTSILMMPWINSQNYDVAMYAIDQSKSEICLGHLEFQGFEMYRGAIIDHGLSHKAFQKFDMVCSGHFHHKSTKDNINYLGAPYEMTWSDYDDPRGFHILDTETKELQYFQNPFIMFHKVFYDDSFGEDVLKLTDFTKLKDSHVKVIIKNKINPYLFDLYIDRLNAENPAHMQVVEDNFNLDLEDDENIVDEAEDTITIIRKYIDNLQLSDNKPMNDLFYDLYHEALSTE